MFQACLALLRLAARGGALLTLLGAVSMIAAPLWSGFDVARQFWPVIMAGALASTLLAGATGAWRFALLGLIAAGLGFIIRPPAPEPPAPPAESGREQALTFVTHNLWGRNVTPGGAIEVIEAYAPDVLALQEVFGEARPISARFAAIYPYQADCTRRSAWLLSRLPIIASGCLEPPSGFPSWTPPSAWARLALPEGGEITVVALHMTWPEPLAPQGDQRRALAAALAPFDRESLVVMGDFNAAAPSLALEALGQAVGVERRTQGLATWPSPLPVMGIDHVFAGPRWRTISVQRAGFTGSDHRPVIARLAINPDAPR